MGGEVRCAAAGRPGSRELRGCVSFPPAGDRCHRSKLRGRCLAARPHREPRRELHGAERSDFGVSPLSDDPAKRTRQLANLRPGAGAGRLGEAPALRHGARTVAPQRSPMGAKDLEDGAPTLYADLVDRLSRAGAGAEVRHVANIARAGTVDWRGGARGTREGDPCLAAADRTDQDVRRRARRVMDAAGIGAADMPPSAVRGWADDIVLTVGVAAECYPVIEEALDGLGAFSGRPVGLRGLRVPRARRAAAAARRHAVNTLGGALPPGGVEFPPTSQVAGRRANAPGRDPRRNELHAHPQAYGQRDAR